MTPRLCEARHPTTGSRCVLNDHPDDKRHAWGPGHRAVLSRTGENLIARMHLASEHALANALDPALTDDHLADYHRHEHDGPCTIRNHPRNDCSYDPAKALTALVEGAVAELDYAVLPPEEKVRIITEMGFRPVRSDHQPDCPALSDHLNRCQCVPPATEWAQPPDVDQVRGETFEQRRQERARRSDV